MVDKIKDYIKTAERLEPDIYPINVGAFYASVAISLKRIADSIVHLETVTQQKLDEIKAIIEEASRDYD